MSSPWVEPPVVTVFLTFLHLVLKGQAGAGGCYHGPPADCERSWRTVNGKGLYIISP